MSVYLSSINKLICVSEPLWSILITNPRIGDSKAAAYLAECF